METTSTVTKAVQDVVERSLVELGVPHKAIRSILARVEHAVERAEDADAERRSA
jgi:hypothetical protein